MKINYTLLLLLLTLAFAEQALKKKLHKKKHAKHQKKDD